MRLSLQSASARGIELELPEIGGYPRVARLDSLTETSGLVETGGGRTRLHPVVARELVLSSGAWVFGFGTVALSTPAVLGSAELDFVAGAGGFEGTIAVGAARSDRLAFDFHGRRLSGDLELERLAVEHTAGKGGQATADSLVIHGVELSLGTLSLSASTLFAKNVRVRWASGTWAVEADSLSLEKVALTLETLGIELSLGQVEIPAWLSVRRDAVRIGEIAVGEARLSADRLSSDGSEPGEDKEERPPPPEEEAGGAKTIDLKVLDQLNGRVDVDLTLDATVPLIGRRKATHHFRVPISDGTLNYHELERDLAALEDSVIDFAVRGGKLVLERDVPLIPGMNKPILTWDLSEVELALAKQRLVRLRTLPGYQLPPRDPSRDQDGKKSRFALRRAHFRNIDVDLSLSPRDAPLEDPIPKAALESLTLRGEVHHHVEREIEPTELRAEGRGLSLALAGVPVGAWALFAESLELESLAEAILRFHGLKPRQLAATLHNLTARSVELRRS